MAINATAIPATLDLFSMCIPIDVWWNAITACAAWISVQVRAWWCW
jgi:hypothetical protein